MGTCRHRTFSLRLAIEPSRSLASCQVCLLHTDAVIPSPWVAVILTLGTFRLLRLISYDTFPPIVKLREHVVGESEWRIELVNCRFCLSFWIGLAVYLLWLWQPTATLYGAAPFALSGAVGLIARNWDA